MFGSIVAGLAAVVGGIVAFVLAVVTLARGLIIPRRYVGAHCGTCGHAVEFNQRGDQCPECGAVLTDVGVVTRSLAARFRTGPVALHCAWLLVCMTLLTVVGYIVMIASIASWGPAAGLGATTWSAAVAPSAPGSYDLEFEADEAATGMTATEIRVGLLIDGTTTPHRLVIDGTTGGWTLFGADDATIDSGSLVDAGAFESLLVAEGVEFTEQRALEAQALAERTNASLQQAMMLDSFMDGSMPVPSTAGVQATVDPRVADPNLFIVATGPVTVGGIGPGFMTSGMVGSLIALGVTALVYVAGAIFIEVRRRRLTGGRRTM